MGNYYQPEIECASPEQIKAWQDERLVKQVKLPNVTGYLIAGLLLGPSVFNIIPETAIHNFTIISSYTSLVIFQASD